MAACECPGVCNHLFDLRLHDVLGETFDTFCRRRHMTPQVWQFSHCCGEFTGRVGEGLELVGAEFLAAPGERSSQRQNVVENARRAALRAVAASVPTYLMPPV